MSHFQYLVFISTEYLNIFKFQYLFVNNININEYNELYNEYNLDILIIDIYIIFALKKYTKHA